VKTGLPDRDERTQAVEDAGYRWSNHVLTFGVLGISAYRSLVLRETTWDLLILVVLGGGVNVAYQASRRVLYPRWVVLSVAALVAAAALAAGMAFLGLGR
jgi:hypothetical protein